MSSRMVLKIPAENGAAKEQGKIPLPFLNRFLFPLTPFIKEEGNRRPNQPGSQQGNKNTFLPSPGELL